MINADEHIYEPPGNYNAVTHFVDRHIDEGRGDSLAVIDANGSYTYQALATRTHQAANLLLSNGLATEDRLVMIQLDDIDFPSIFWGAIRAGVIPVPINTMLTATQFKNIIQDSNAKAVCVSAQLLAVVEPVLKSLSKPVKVFIAGAGESSITDAIDLASGLDASSKNAATANTCSDQVAFWLYSSGSTGNPKGVRHLHKSLKHTAQLYSDPILELTATDRVFSAAKLFFAYGLGNALTFPMHVGACSILLDSRPTPDACLALMREHKASVFFGVPTLYAGLLADAENTPARCSPALRLCVSAGEALPEDIAKEWQSRFSVDILDGIGSTEMLHIFLSNRVDDWRYGTTGKPVPGYEARLVDTDGNDVADGDIGDLLVKGASAAEGYWNQRAKSLRTFLGPWTVTGDKYYRDSDGFYHYCGRGDDMFKVSGQWVSPFEVESALISHPSVLEAAVVQHDDGSGLIKPKAFVVRHKDSQTLEFDTLKEHVKNQIEAWKYPREIDFVDELPKTTTGKIQRYKLRV